MLTIRLTVLGNILNTIKGFFSGGSYRDIDLAYWSAINNLPGSRYIGVNSAIKNGYVGSDLVYSIVSKKAQTGARAPFGVYKIKSLKAAKAYHDYLKEKNINLNKLIALKESAIEPTRHYLNDKFQNPNEDISGTDYTEALLIYLNVTGNTYEQVVRKGKRSEVLSLYPTPPQIVTINTDGKYPVTASGYTLRFDSELNLGKEEIIHTKYFNPLFTNSGTHLYGLSPIQVGWDLINSDDEGFKAISEQRKNRGARKLAGIENEKISNYTDGKEMMDRMKEEFTKRDREFRDRVMPIWGRLSVHDIGLSEKDMDILNTGQVSFDRLCNIFHVPVEWFNSNKQSKFNNLEQYNKQAILNGIIPDLNKIRDSRNRWARRYGVLADNEMIDVDYTVFNELDIDKKAMWEWLKDSPFTENEKRVFLGENESPIAGMSDYYINRNRISISKINELKNEAGNQAQGGQNADQGAGSQEGQGDEN